MSDRKRPVRRLSICLIAAGMVLLLMAGACSGRSQLRDPQTPPAATSAALAPAIEEPTFTALPPTAPVPEATQPALTASLSPVPATPVPSASTVMPPPRTSTAAPAPIAPTITPGAASFPVRLVIPGLKIDVPVVEMGWRVVQTANGPRSDWVIPENEAGYHINSAGLGEDGNLVISGHNNIFGQVFKSISFAWDNDTLTVVDRFTDRSDVLNGRAVQLFDATGQRFDYVVSAFYRLKDTGVSAEQRIANGRFMEPTDHAQVTIITCWPPSSNTHRLILIAMPVN